MSSPEPAERSPDLVALSVPMARIVRIGTLGWCVALAVLLLVPDWHTGGRAWWPWCAAAGVALGLVGWAYLARGRGNAADARGDRPGRSR